MVRKRRAVTVQVIRHPPANRIQPQIHSLYTETKLLLMQVNIVL